jgi:hypothetical protein
MLDQETWLFINTFAPWLAALGTIAAVVTSLYLARRSDRIDLRLSVGIRTLALLGGGAGHGTDFVFLNITNLGRRSATLTAIFWKPVPWRKSGLFWIPPQNANSSSFPITLTDGQSANYALPVAQFEENFRDYAHEMFSGFTGFIRLRLVRMCVSTSTGDQFSQEPEKQLRDLLRRMATQQPTQSAA